MNKLTLASGIQRKKEKRGKENGSRTFSEPAVFVSQVAKRQKH